MRALGLVFASGSAGALLGGLLFGFIGDRVGRRRAIVVSVGLFGLFTLLLAAADRTSELLLARFVGGIALGGALPLIWALSIEYVPTRYRSTVVTLIMLGYGLGVFASGPLSIALIPHHGWQSVFILGGIASLGAAVLVWYKLPESLRFLAQRGGDPERIARIVRRLIPDRRIRTLRSWCSRPRRWRAHAARPSSSTVSCATSPHCSGSPLPRAPSPCISS